MAGASANLAHQRIGELCLRRDLVLACGLEVPTCRLAIHDSIARQLARTLTRLHAAQDLSNIDHRQLPKTHGASCT